MSITNEQRDRICAVIDAVKMDEKLRDTNEYAAEIESILTTNIPQTSASERVETAQKALATWDDIYDGVPADMIEREADAVANALRALITPPAVGDESIAKRIAAEHYAGYAPANLPADLSWEHLAQSFGEVAVAAFRAGIQSAHESWEPADVPSQEFMLRHLGIRYGDAGRPTHIHIPFQNIEKEVI